MNLHDILKQKNKKQSPNGALPTNVEEADAATARTRAGLAKRKNTKPLSAEEQLAKDKAKSDKWLEKERAKMAAKKGVTEGELTEASVKFVDGHYQVVHNGKVVATYPGRYAANDHAHRLNNKPTKTRGKLGEDADQIQALYDKLERMEELLGSNDPRVQAIKDQIRGMKDEYSVAGQNTANSMRGTDEGVAENEISSQHDSDWVSGALQKVSDLKNREKFLATGKLKQVTGWKKGSAATADSILDPKIVHFYDRRTINQGVAEGLPQTLRKVVPGYAKREIDKKMDAGKFGKTDADKDANFQRYKKIQDKLKEGEPSPMFKDAQKTDRIRSLKNLIAIAKEQGRQLRVQELELELKKLQGVAETKVSKYADLGATKDTTHFIKNVTTGEIMSPHRGKADAEDALVSYYRGPSDGNKYKIVRARKEGMVEGSEFGSNYAEQLAQQVFDSNPDLDASGRADAVLDAGYAIAKAELGPRVRGVFRDEDFPSDFVSAYAWLQKQDDDEDYYALPMPNGDRDMAEDASPETSLHLLKGLKTWCVTIMNNYYRGKYSDYSGRYFYVLATSPEEARQVVLDNADAILQDLLALKSHNGKKILPRSKAIRITDKEINKIEDGTVVGRMSTAGFKKMYSPQGIMHVKLSNGAIADVQGQEQGMVEGAGSGYTYKDTDEGTYLTNDWDETLFIPDVRLRDQGFRQGDRRLPEVWQMNLEMADETGAYIVGEEGQELDEVSRGDYYKKATMAKAMAQMSAGFAKSPEEKEKFNQIAGRRERGLGMAKARTDKFWADKAAKDEADRMEQLRAKYAGVDIDAEIAKLKPAIQRAYHEYQYGARNTYSQGRDEYNSLMGKVQELERAREALGKDQSLNELSNELLGNYKKAAGISARDLDKAGKYAKADKRFHGIVQATKKEFNNDMKKYQQDEVTESRLSSMRKAGYDIK